MNGTMKKQRLTATITGTSGSGYGHTYGEPIVGEIRRIDFSGTGLGSTGWFTLKESGTMLSTAFIAGSEATEGDMVWNAGVVPVCVGRQGNFLGSTLIGGSAYGYYPTTGVPELTVSGCQSGTAFNMDIYWLEHR